MGNQVKVCTSIAVGQSLLAPHLAKFRQTYPEVQVDLHLTNRRVDIIEEGFDLALRVGQLDDSNLVAKRLCAREMHLYTSPAYLDVIKMNIDDFESPKQLSSLDCLLMNGLSKKPQWLLSKKKIENLVKINPVFCSDDFNVLRQLTEDGAGITVLPDYICHQSIMEGKLVRILPEWLFKKVDIFALYPSHKGATPKLRAFIDYLVQCLVPPKKA